LSKNLSQKKKKGYKREIREKVENLFGRALVQGERKEARSWIKKGKKDGHKIRIT